MRKGATLPAILCVATVNALVALRLLLLKSRYVPKALADWGIFSSSVLAVVTLAIMVFPGLGDVVGMAYMAPMGIYEVGLGLWLLVKGIQAPSAERTPQGGSS